MKIDGTTHAFGDRIDTDLLSPGAYMKGPIEEMAKHCLEAIDPEFPARSQLGDIVTAGFEFGTGSSREQAASCLLLNGIGCVLARSFARIFYRNALNLGLPVLVCPTAHEIPAGTRLVVDPLAGTATEAGGRVHSCEPIPERLMQMVAAGGLIPFLEQTRTQ
ncbi:3-isopropylmalate dehydratase [Arenibacterium halophilum]|uniref:3-isopropylmalate dehydratase n=1 Tax=Arenibacterium halophilum TaxID=2583821 RepID=A0ABY2XFR7_9RHOB|nr:3-isopropylmalate dehydratase [Arenibacterium halophilum]TMV15513.1 3-isopropylmalate dehydratase [Arenibacterium halophilum]